MPATPSIPEQDTAARTAVVPDAASGRRFDAVLAELFPEFSRSRLAEWIMSRPQIQEEAITQMAELLLDKVRPDGLAVVMEADHFCMHWRGVRDNQTNMINSVMRGSFLKDPALRRAFLSLLTLRD